MDRNFLKAIIIACTLAITLTAAIFAFLAGGVGFLITAVISAFMVGWTGWGLTLGLATVGALVGVGVTISVLAEDWDGYKAKLRAKLERKRAAEEEQLKALLRAVETTAARYSQPV